MARNSTGFTAAAMDGIEMSWTACTFWLLLMGGASLIWIGTRKRRNRRKRGVLPPPSSACQRNTPEAPC